MAHDTHTISTEPDDPSTEPSTTDDPSTEPSTANNTSTGPNYPSTEPSTANDSSTRPNYPLTEPDDPLTEPSTAHDPLTSEEGASIRNTAPDNTASMLTFSPKQIELFSKRFSGCFDIYDDQEYVRWLHLTHPEAVPSTRRMATFLHGPSVLDEFCDVSPLLPLSDDPSTDTMTSAPSHSVLQLTDASSNLTPENSSAKSTSTFKSSNYPLALATPSRQTDESEQNQVRVQWINF